MLNLLENTPSIGHKLATAPNPTIRAASRFRCALTLSKTQIQVALIANPHVWGCRRHSTCVPPAMALIEGTSGATMGKAESPHRIPSEHDSHR